MAQTFRLCKIDILYCHRAYSTQRHYEHYKVLGVTPKSTRKEIRDAFVKRSKELHPDLSGKHNHDEFVKLTEAYNALSKIEPINESYRSGNTVRNETGYNPYSRHKYQQFYGYYNSSYVRDTVKEHVPWMTKEAGDYFDKLPQFLTICGLIFLLISIVFHSKYLQEERSKQMSPFSQNSGRIITPRD